jgi:hypothetical protein
MASILLPGAATAGSASHDELGIGADLGALALRSDASGIATYAPGIAYGAHLVVPLAPWLSVAPYYLRATHGVRLGGDLGAGAPLSRDGSLVSYELGLRVQPTLTFGPRARAWIGIGAAWGVLSYPAVNVAAADPYTIRTSDSVRLQVPFGLGGQYDVVRDWLAVEAGVSWGLGIDGSSTERVQSISRSGQVVTTPRLPNATSSIVALGGVVLFL